MIKPRMLADIRKKLTAAGIADPMFEAQEIVKEYCGGEIRIGNGEPMSEISLARINTAVERRCKGEPLQYIFGKWEFYGYPFYVGEGVLIPRPETELLVDLAVKRLNAESTVLDLFSGTGCVAVSIALKTGAKCYAVELHDAAFSYLERNIELNKADVKARKADACSRHFPLVKFDAIFANPPYITDEEMKSLMREVRYEPETALCGGADGLDYYRKFIPVWSERIKDGGFMACEIGETQGEAVSVIMREAGLKPDIMKDLAGHDRVVVGEK